MKRVISVVLSIAIIIGLFLTVPNINAESKNFGSVLLESGKTYYYNLDKKGEKEKILFTRIANGEDKYKCVLKINGKVAFSANVNLFMHNDVRVVVADTDEKDKQMEVFIVRGDCDDLAWITNFRHIYYYKYANKKLSRVQDLKEQINKRFANTVVHAKSDKTYFNVDGKGKLTARLCMHMNNTVAFYHFNDTFKLKNGKFSLSSTDTFKLLDEGGYYISSAKNVTYTKINGNKKSFTLKKGSKFYKTKLIVRNGNVFLLLKNTANKTGYINFKKLKYKITGTLHVGGGFVI